MRGIFFFPPSLSPRYATRDDMKILITIRIEESLGRSFIAENLRNREYTKLKILQKTPRLSNIEKFRDV